MTRTAATACNECNDENRQPRVAQLDVCSKEEGRVLVMICRASGAKVLDDLTLLRILEFLPATHSAVRARRHGIHLSRYILLLSRH